MLTLSVSLVPDRIEIKRESGTMPENLIPEDAMPVQTPRAEPTLVTGPIIGIPWAEVRIWMQTWGTGKKVSPPKPRRIE